MIPPRQANAGWGVQRLGGMGWSGSIVGITGVERSRDPSDSRDLVRSNPPGQFDMMVRDRPTDLDPTVSDKIPTKHLLTPTE